MCILIVLVSYQFDYSGKSAEMLLNIVIKHVGCPISDF